MKKINDACSQSDTFIGIDAIDRALACQIIQRRKMARGDRDFSVTEQELFDLEMEHTKKLLPCPFCNNSKAPCPEDTEEAGMQVGSDEWWRVCCDVNDGGCGASSGFHRTIQDAIAAWNRRHIGTRRSTDRTRVISCLVEGNSQRSTVRITGIAKNTVKPTEAKEILSDQTAVAAGSEVA